MGKIRWIALKLALFTAFTVVITYWLAAVIGNFQPFTSPYTVQAEFSNATGLLNGDVVKAAGVTIGRVGAIEIEDGMALVTMSIKEDVELPENAGVEIRFRNLVGQRMVVFTDNEQLSTEVMDPGTVIPLDRTEPAFDLTELFNGLRPLIRSTSPEDINIVARTLTKVLKGRNSEVESLLTNLSDVADTISGEDQALSSLLDGLNVVTSDLASRDRQLKVTLSSINIFLGKILKNRAALRTALVTLDDAATRLNRIVKTNASDIKVSVRSLAKLLEVVNAKRRDLHIAINELPAFLQGVERVTSYGQWANAHVITVCKDDFGVCGRRARP
jgi:phospholipid/cholesterol/gamma-HCH transport system substrate-binding protein